MLVLIFGILTMWNNKKPDTQPGYSERLSKTMAVFNNAEGELSQMQFEIGEEIAEVEEHLARLKLQHSETTDALKRVRQITG